MEEIVLINLEVLRARGRMRVLPEAAALLVAFAKDEIEAAGGLEAARGAGVDVGLHAELPAGPPGKRLVRPAIQKCS